MQRKSIDYLRERDERQGNLFVVASGDKKNCYYGKCTIVILVCITSSYDKIHITYDASDKRDRGRGRRTIKRHYAVDLDAFQLTLYVS